jgi:large subunit ribosomal protein L24
MKIKKGDKVIVTAGKSKGATGTVVRAMPSEGKVLIDGVNVAKRHRRPTAQSRKGQIVDIPMPLPVSNVQIVDPKSGKPTRVRIQRDKDGNASRIAVKSGQELK